MPKAFELDPYPGRPKILFIGVPYSSHVHGWIDLLAGAQVNTRLFGVQDGHPPHNWLVRSYVITPYPPAGLDPETRLCLYPTPEERGDGPAVPVRAASDAEWLAHIIREWQPDVIQTFGREPAGEYYRAIRCKYELEAFGLWSHWVWGGAELAVYQFNPDLTSTLATFLADCDQLLMDNLPDREYALKLGVNEAQFAPLNPVPAAGGVDVQPAAGAEYVPPSQRRMILWPKAYDAPWSVALPVFEALKACWEQLQPCTIHMLSMTTEGTRMWYHTLPAAIRQNSRIYDRIPHAAVLQLMSQARVMLAPSLTDGFPNVVYESMAAAALPIVSPLATMTPFLEPERNVLFARNLYVDEIAAALIRAMTDDALVETVAQNNRLLVRRIADRNVIGPKVIDYYEDLARMFRQTREFHIVQRDQQLEQRDQQLEQRDQQLEQRERMLGEREQVLSQCERVLGQREVDLQKNVQVLAERQLALGQSEVALEQSAQGLTEREQRLGQQADTLAAGEVALRAREQSLSVAHDELERREARYRSLLVVRLVRAWRRWLQLQ